MNPNHPGAHDFDFLIGDWQVRHARLKARLCRCDEWQAFDGHCSMRPLLDGRGNVDDNVLDLPEGRYRAVGLRSFDPASGQWAIWWLDGRNPHTIDVPVIGGFEQGVGTFLADETINGQPVRVRFRWTEVDTGSPHWEQAFSPDGGQTWETNWRMRFSRVGTASALGTSP